MRIKNGTCVCAFIFSFKRSTEVVPRWFFFEKSKLEVDQVKPTSTKTKLCSFTLQRGRRSSYVILWLGSARARWERWERRERLVQWRSQQVTIAWSRSGRARRNRQPNLFRRNGESSPDGERYECDIFLGTFGQHFFTRLQWNLVFWITNLWTFKVNGPSYLQKWMAVFYSQI